MSKLLTLPFRAPVALALTPFLGVLLYVLLRRPAVGAWCSRHKRALLWLAEMLAVFAVAFLIVGNLATTGMQRPLGHDEVSILSVAAAYRNGQPMYPSPGSAMEYGMLYGPATFFAYLPPMFAGALRFGWFQAWAGMALLLACVFTYRALRTAASATLGRLALAYVAMCLATTAWFAWGVRSDAWILLFFAIAMWAAMRLRPVAAEAAIAVCGAALVSLKFVLVLPALLPFLLLWQRDPRPRARRIAAVPALFALAAAPFLLPRISLTSYRYELALATRHGLSHQQLLTNVLVVLLNYITPLAASMWAAALCDRAGFQAWLRRRRGFLVLLLLCTAALGISGAKNGAGAWHLMPLSLPCALMHVELWTMVRQSHRRDRRIAAMAPALWIGLALFVRGNMKLVDTVHMRLHDDPALTVVNYEAVQQDLLRLLAEHPDSRVQMGYSGTAQYNVTWMRHVLLLRGQTLLLDANTQNEMDASREPYAPAFLQAIADCRADLWLIPRGATPFSMRSPYADDPDTPPGFLPRPELFPAPLPEIFQQHYQAVPSHSRFFDLWACRTPAAKMKQ